MKFIGDLSLQDADLLQSLSSYSKRILEFGAGGSTQIFAQCFPKTLHSVETSIYWLKLTGYRIDQLPGATKPVFLKYGEECDNEYDLIFVDGMDCLRKEFAFRSWKQLDERGCLIFHDTRRGPDISLVSSFIESHYNEICLIEPNLRDSNCTVIWKKKYQPYINWQEVEGKKEYEYGPPSPAEKKVIKTT